MKFVQLSDTIPYAIGGKEKVLTYRPYPNIKIAMPGRHQKETTPVGGDFVVMVSEKAIGWRDHQFNHSDIFSDLHRRTVENSLNAVDLMSGYKYVVQGGDPDEFVFALSFDPLTCLPSRRFLHAVQCLALAEHRRYAKYEKKFGGRYLPFRFAAGIVEGLWTADEASAKERMGRPGVEWLEQTQGVPVLTQELFDA